MYSSNCVGDDMREVFYNRRTKQEATELPSHGMLSETEAKTGLIDQGWEFPAEYYFDEDNKKFIAGKKKAEDDGTGPDKLGEEDS